MKLNTVTKFLLTADYWDFTTAIDPTGNAVNTYFYDSTIDISLDEDPTAVRIVILSEEPIRRSALLKNLKDRDGKPVLGDAQYKTTTIEPVLNVYGQRVGYRLMAALWVDPSFSEE